MSNNYISMIAKEREASESICQISRTNDKKLVELTFENVAIVEAMIRENSSYGKDDAKSSKLLIKELEASNNENYKDIIRKIVIAVDNENSTHLNSDYRSEEKHGTEKAFKGGREAVTERLAKHSLDELKNLLKNKSYELFYEIANPKSQKENKHFSFASKLCHNLCMVLFECTEFEDLYCKYDTVLEKALPKYYEAYCNGNIKPKDYKENYAKYMKYVEEIREAAFKKHGKKISNNGFDHLIWYCHKG